MPASPLADAATPAGADPAACEGERGAAVGGRSKARRNVPLAVWLILALVAAVALVALQDMLGSRGPGGGDRVSRMVSGSSRSHPWWDGALSNHQLRAVRAGAGGAGFPAMVIGVPRGGTTLIHEALVGANFAVRSRRTQLHFFDRTEKQARVWGDYGTLDGFFKQFEDVQTSPDGSPQALVDTTPTYLAHSPAATDLSRAFRSVYSDEQIKALRFVVSLREPLDRILSHLRLAYFRGKEPDCDRWNSVLAGFPKKPATSVVKKQLNKDLQRMIGEVLECRKKYKGHRFGWYAGCIREQPSQRLGHCNPVMISLYGEQLRWWATVMHHAWHGRDPGHPDFKVPGWGSDELNGVLSHSSGSPFLLVDKHLISSLGSRELVVHVAEHLGFDKRAINKAALPNDLGTIVPLTINASHTKVWQSVGPDDVGKRYLRYLYTLFTRDRLHVAELLERDPPYDISWHY